MSKGNIRITVGIPTFNRADLLRESLTSVLSQSYRDFRLLVCDNASEDDTEETVASFADSRIDYVRSDENIGMVENFNRVIGLTETEFLVLLPDDDLLYPEHLHRTIAILARHPQVGVVHTAFDLIDGSSRVVEHNQTLVKVDGAVTVEAGADYLERSMRSTWTICWPSALFRTRALADAGGLREDQEPMSDVPLLMRIACDWDFACLSSTLAAFRFHPHSQTAAVGSYAGTGYAFSDGARMFHTQRLRFLNEATLPQASVDRCRSIAQDTLCRGEVRQLAERGGMGTPWMSTWRMLARLLRRHPRAVLLPATWRLCGAQLGGRYAKRAAHRLRHRTA